MKFKDIISIGAKMAGTAYPPLGMAITAINKFLPADKKLPANSTGDDVNHALAELPVESASQLLEKEIELDITESNNWASIQRSHAEADSKGSSTRPWIAKLMAFQVFICSTPIAILLCFAIAKGNDDMIIAIGTAWPTVLAVLGPAIVLLRAYFGLRTDEKKSRYAASVGQPINMPMNLLGKIFKGK